MRAQLPATSRLTRRRRCVLYLRAQGQDYDTIAERLGVSKNVVQKDLMAINKTLIPGVTDGDHPAKGYRVVYVLGLLDAGVPPEEIGAHLDALEDRIRWLQSLDAAGIGPDEDDNPLAMVAG